MGYKNDCFSWIFFDFFKEVIALSLECLIAYGKDFVKHEDISLRFNCYRECEADLHARRVVFELLIHEVAELCKIYDIVVHGIDFCIGEAK